MSHPANPALPVTNAIDVARHAQSDMRLPRQPRCARIAGQRPVRHLYGPRRCSFRVMALIKTVVVTGSSGYIGSEVTKQCLERGYHTRAVLRSAIPEVTGPLKALGDALPGSLQLQYVPDITASGAYDEVVAGASYVIHCASPIGFNTGNIDADYRTVIEPAVQGATNIIGSVAKHAKNTIQRIVLTSSGAALSPQGYKPDKVFSEADWNTKDTPESSAYAFGKVQAELAAFDLAEKHGISLVSILPTLVFGPVLLDRPNRTGISIDSVKSVLEGGPWSAIAGLRQVDIRDVAAAHIRACEIPHANGRYIVSRPYTTNLKEVQLAMQAEFPDIDFQQAEAAEPRHVVNSSKAERDLGLRWIPPATSIVDEARTLLQLGIAMPKLKA